MTKLFATEDQLSQTLVELQSRQVSRSQGGASLLSIVRTLANGNRVTMAPQIIVRTNANDSVQIAAYGEGIVVGPVLPGNHPSFTLRISGKKYIVYCRSLVDELAQMFELDFAGRTAVSFYDVSYWEEGEHTVAYVPLRKTEQIIEEPAEPDP